MHGLQAWVALPAEKEEVEPSFVHYDAEGLPIYEADGAWGRLVAGTAFGMEARVRGSSPLFYLHWELRPGARTQLPSEHEERAIYVARGHVEVEGRTYDPGQMLVFTPGTAPTILASTEATVMALGGSPLGHRFIWWNFVSSRQERIEQAKADWAAGRMALPANDPGDPIPLPPPPEPDAPQAAADGEPKPPPEPMS